MRPLSRQATPGRMSTVRRDHDVRVELIVLNGPAKLPVPLAKRNPSIEFVVEQQRQQEHRSSATPVHAKPQCQHSAVFSKHVVDVLRLVQCQANLGISEESRIGCDFVQANGNEATVPWTMTQTREGKLNDSMGYISSREGGSASVSTVKLRQELVCVLLFVPLRC
jgi:hypothetical protein